MNTSARDFCAKFRGMKPMQNAFWSLADRVEDFWRWLSTPGGGVGGDVGPDFSAVKKAVAKEMADQLLAMEHDDVRAAMKMSQPSWFDRLVGLFLSNDRARARSDARALEAAWFDLIEQSAGVSIAAQRRAITAQLAGTRPTHAIVDDPHQPEPPTSFEPVHGDRGPSVVVGAASDALAGLRDERREWQTLLLRWETFDHGEIKRSGIETTVARIEAAIEHVKALEELESAVDKSGEDMRDRITELEAGLASARLRGKSLEARRTRWEARAAELEAEVVQIALHHLSWMRVANDRAKRIEALEADLAQAVWVQPEAAGTLGEDDGLTVIPPSKWPDHWKAEAGAKCAHDQGKHVKGRYGGNPHWCCDMCDEPVGSEVKDV